jgi:uncharacterized protein YndB with AHSA1/START domain
VEKFELEFLIKTSPSVLYTFISTPSGLAEWFCHDVNIKKEVYTFMWDGSEEQANLIGKKAGLYIKFHWVDHEDDDTFFELRIRIDSLTKEVALIVTDFADEDELEETQMLWANQVNDLKHALGAH